MVRSPDKDRSLVVRPPIGGLQTRIGSPLVAPSQSPDAINVLFDRQSCKRRPGCVPINRNLPGKNSLRNRGRSYAGREQSAPNEAVTFKTVPGHGIAGHRTYLNDYRTPTNDVNLTVSCLVTPEPGGDDDSENVNWFVFNEAVGAGGNPFRYRPILSKGPIGLNSMAAAAQFGVGEGLAWSFGVRNEFNAGTALYTNRPQWYCAFSLDNPNATIELLSDPLASTAPRPGHIYRLTFCATTITPGAAWAYHFIISELNGDETVGAEVLTTGRTARRLATNTGPVLFFDMPQAAFDDIALFIPVTPPEVVTEYRAGVLRFEGKVEDISIWKVDKSANLADQTFVRSMEVLDLTANQAGLLAYWRPETMSERQLGDWYADQGLIPESLGKDQPILLCPTIPWYNRASGRGGLYFDGRTSYAMMTTGINTVPLAPTVGQAGQSNWNYCAQGPGPNSNNSWEYLIRTGTTEGGVSHSIQMTFVPDSLEPRAGGNIESQCLFFWWGCVTFGITTTGVVYCRPAIAGPAFAALSVGTTVLVPGQRYTLLYRRASDGLSAQVYLNGELEFTIAAGLSIPGLVADGLPAFLLGVADTNNVAVSTGRGTPRGTNEQLHFLGRIEDLRLAGGLLDPLLWNMPLSPSQVFVDAARPWAFDSGTAIAGGNASAPFAMGGHWFHSPYNRNYAKTPAEFFSRDTQKALLIMGADGGAPAFNLALAAAPPAWAAGPPAVAGVGDAGAVAFDGVDVQNARISQYLAWWDLSDEAGPYPILEQQFAIQETRYRFDREYNVTGRYIYQVEYLVPDRFDSGQEMFSWPMTLRSRQPDIDASVSGTFVGQYTFPWLQITPMELRPRLARGIVPGRPSTNPITFVGQLLKQDRKFEIVAAASSLYWLQPPWDHTSPYSVAADPAQTSWFSSGRLNNHIQIRANADWAMTAIGTDRTIEFWIKVPELGTRRELAISWDGAVAQGFNWRVTLTENGGVYVEGWAGGAFWRIGTHVAAGGGPSFTGPITPGRWQFVAITLDADASVNDRIWVDGVLQAMDAPIGNHNAAWAGTAATVPKFIGGHPRHFQAPNFETVPIADRIWRPFFGWMRDFRVSNTLRYTQATQSSFPVPLVPLTADANTITLLALNDGADLVAAASGTGVYKGTIRVEEMIPILEGSLIGNNSTERFPYSGTQSRDVLFISNGLGPPLAIRNDGYMRSALGKHPTQRGPDRPYGFYVGRHGITPPGRDPPALILPVTGTLFNDSAQLQLAVTFVSFDFLESDPVAYTMTTPANGGNDMDRITLQGIPRSLEPHVVARRIYIGDTAGATPKLYSETQLTDDNVTDEVELTQAPGAGKDIEFTNGPMPFVRFLRVYRGRCYGLGVAGRNQAELYFSEGLLVESVNRSRAPTNVIELESGTGSAGTGIYDHLGQLYASTRRTIYNVVPGARDVTSFRVYPTATARGFLHHGAVVSWDNDLMGPIQKGVCSFNGEAIDYWGGDLEGLWAVLDLTEDGVRHMHGAYLDDRNQYWLTVKRIGERFGRELACYDREVADPITKRHPWSLIQTIRHSFLALIEDPVDGAFKIHIGTPEGQVLHWLAPGSAISAVGFDDCDGSRQLNDPGVAAGGFVMQGVALGGSTTTLVPLLGGAGQPTLDKLGHGMRGLWCLVTFSHTNHTAPFIDKTFEVRIRFNTDTTITFETPLPEPVQAFGAGGADTFVIGGFWAYQSTPWLPLGQFSQVKMSRVLDFDFKPNAGTLLDVRYHVNDRDSTGALRNLDEIFDYAGVPTTRRYLLPMTDGYHTETLRLGDRGHYWRLFFGTRGINQPFEIYGWDVGFVEAEGARKGLT